MDFEKTLSTVFPALLLAPVIFSAYWTGSGAAELAGSQGLPLSVETVVQQVPASKPSSDAELELLPNAAPLLAHNVFDHQTDISRPPAPPPTAASTAKPEAERLDLSDPLGAEPCEDVSAEIVTEAIDPLRSVAVLQEDGEKNSQTKQVGDSFGEYEVQYIGFNRVQRSPSVWMTQGTTLCQVLLFDGEEESAKKSNKKLKRRKAKSKKSKKNRRRRGRVPQGIADKIEKVSDTEFDVDRSVIDDILEKKAQLMRGTRFVPQKGKGGASGIRVFGIRPKTLLGSLGLKNGDRVQAVNGFDIADPQKALQAYAKVRMADTLEVEVTRRGKPVTIELNVK